MRRTAIVMTVALVVSAVAAVPLSGAAAQSTDAQTTSAPFAAVEQAENGTANDSANVTPGGQFMGVIGVQQSEFGGEIAERSFGLQVARANSNESKAAVVGEQVAELRERLTELDERKQQLREARRNGSISEAKYSAKMSELTSETETVRRLANATSNESAGLPADLLAEHGVNATAIETLKTDAANLTGPEVARIARTIVGPDVGKAIGEDRRPDDRGQSERGESDGQRGADETTTGNETTGNETTVNGDETTAEDDETPGQGTNGSSDSERETTESGA